MSQYDKLQSRIREQTHRILNKIHKKTNYKEVSLHQIEFALYQSASTPVSEGDDAEREKMCEWLNENLAKLELEEMNLIKLKFYEGMTDKEIGINYGFTESWARKRVKIILGKLRSNSTSA